MGWTRDLKIALTYLYDLCYADHARLTLLGFSNGAAASIYLASYDKRVSFVASYAYPSEFDSVTEPRSLIH
ncbi:hypothetical protein ACFLT8_07175, partial [Chloroflexota bacterium]